MSDAALAAASARVDALLAHIGPTPDSDAARGGVIDYLRGVVEATFPECEVR
jgi:hypothetical protein